MEKLGYWEVSGQGEQFGAGQAQILGKTRFADTESYRINTESQPNGVPNQPNECRIASVPRATPPNGVSVDANRQQGVGFRIVDLTQTLPARRFAFPRP